MLCSHAAVSETEKLLRDLRLRGGLGLVDPRYARGTLVGRPFAQVSKVTWSIGGTQVFRLATAPARLTADYHWQSTQHFFVPTALPSGSPFAAGNDVAEVNVAATAATTQRGYGLLDARLEVDIPRRPLTVSFFVRNAADKQYKTRAADFVSAGIGIVPYLAGDPRTFGISFAIQIR